MEFKEFTGKTVDDALTSATIELETTSDNLEYEVIEAGSNGILGIGKKPAKIKARKKVTIEDAAREFLEKVFKAMNLIVNIDINFSEEDKTMDINLSGEEMGLLIGKRGQTIDSIQYLVSLVVNKESKEYLRVKVDTENYRERRKATLEELAKNIAYKVKRTKRAVSLEPMNPYERRIIHATVTDIEGVTSHSKGEEPYRKVIITSTEKRPYSKGGYNKRNNQNRQNRNKQKGYDIVSSFEKEYKKPKPEDSLGSGLYTKIDL